MSGRAGTSTAGIYIDDTPVQSRHIGFGAVNVFPQLFDVGRVEVRWKQASALVAALKVVPRARSARDNMLLPFRLQAFN